MGKLEDIALGLRSRKRLPFDSKLWAPGKLIVYLAKEVRRLRKTQCKPCMHCIFKYDSYMDEVYGTDSGEQSFIHHAPRHGKHPIYVDEDEES